MSVDVTLMQAPDAIQLSRLSLSARSAQMDLVWTDDIVLASYAKSGWPEPLDDLWAKHQQELNRNDISPTPVKSCMFDGHIYDMPSTVNTTTYAYRADLYEQKGLTPATTWDRYSEKAEPLTSPPRRYGATIALKADLVANELNAVRNTIGEGWLDHDW